SYPDSVTLKIRTNNVTPGIYTVTVTGKGRRGTPIHERRITVDVNTNANTISVLSPNGGENWTTGSLRNITWVRTGVVDSVKIDYSTNNGTSWINVTPGVPASPSTYAWTVPNTPTTQGRVRVSWTDSASVNDMSDAAFTISSATFPIITTSPDSIVASLQVGGGTTDRTLTIGNTGTANLTWSLSESGAPNRPYVRQPQADELYPNWEAGKGEADRYRGPERAETDTIVGPDSAGYRAIDSDSPGGPTYSWTDITGTGTPITGWAPNSDDGVVTVALPFSFTFYGSTYDSVRVCTNGFVMFGVSNTAYSNGPIPATALPNNACYGFWDDLNLTSGGTV
ncbi:MAG: hypothetical protein AAB393_08235, partial [Bacteroidota bacterium]